MKPSESESKILSPLEILADQEYGVGETVYHKSRTSNDPGLVTGILIRTRSITYMVTWGYDLTERYHGGIELCREFKPSLAG